MKFKEHTRNQKRMYRIHKQDEKIHDLELVIGKLQQENKQLKEKINKTVEIHRINIYWNYETKYTKHTHLDKAINKQIEELGWNKC